MLEVFTVTLFLMLVLTVGALYWQGGGNVHGGGPMPIVIRTSPSTEMDTLNSQELHQ